MAEIITTGKTVDEAVEEACRQLGVTREEISVEILEMPQKILFFSKPAKVKVTKAESEFSVHDLLYGDGHNAPKSSEKKEQSQKPKKDQKQKNKEQEKNQKSKRTEEPKQSKEPKQAKEQKQEKEQKKEQKASANEQKKAKKSAEKSEKKEQKKAAEEIEELKEDVVLESIPEDQLPERAVNSFNFLKQIVSAYGAENITYSFAKTERGVCIQIGGEDAPMLIGKRGELMDAIQYLCTVGSSREGGDYCRVSLDVEGYRSRREASLRSLASKTANKVKKNHRSMSLEPMNPYERAIVHSEVQKIEGVDSHSVGSEPRRKVVITLEGDSSDDGRRNRRSRSGRSGRVSEEKTESTAKVKMSDIPVRKELKSTEEFIGSLYGKIEL